MVSDRWSDGRSYGCHFLFIVGSGVRRMDVVVFCQKVSIESDKAWSIVIDVVWQVDIIGAMSMLAIIAMFAIASGGPE